MISLSPVSELEENKTRGTQIQHPDINNVIKSSINLKSTNINLRDTVRPNSYPGSSLVKISLPAKPTNKMKLYRYAKVYQKSLRKK